MTCPFTLSCVIGLVVFRFDMVLKVTLRDVRGEAKVTPMFVTRVQSRVDGHVVLARELLPTKGTLEALGNKFAG